MLSVEKSDVKKLGKEQLEEVITLLCEAELQAHGYHAKGVLSGGHINANDGGIDVLVKLANPLTYTEGFVSNQNSGFQSKASDLKYPKSEMLRNGALKPAISQLLAAGGSYTIVSGHADISPVIVEQREQEMCDMAKCKLGQVAYYDADRLSRCISEYPHLVIKVREMVGRSIGGWKPYGNWSFSPNAGNDLFIIDDETILSRVGSTGKKEHKGINGIHSLRNQLYDAKAIIRLVGLSGTGKTRYVRALFEQGVGNFPVQPQRVVYGDTGDELIPAPEKLLKEAIRLNNGTIIVVDNCTPNLHGRLAKTLANSDSKVGLLTIEHDIRENIQEDTSVFKLEPGSTSTVKIFLESQFPDHPARLRNRISALAGRNFRIAVALAKSIGKGLDVSGISDLDLFKRLFYQNGEEDKQLFTAAGVLSLLYSFDYKKSSKSSEIATFSRISDLEVKELTVAVKSLKRKDLLQSRGGWRAILPHALANRLAKDYLAENEVDFILDEINLPANRRMLKSLANRIGFLTDSQEAKEIASRWLADDGILNLIEEYDEHLIIALKHIVHLQEGRVLEIIERWVFGAEISAIRAKFITPDIVKIIIFIAYNEDYFERCLDLLLHLRKEENIEDYKKSQAHNISLFFQRAYCGTLASPKRKFELFEQRFTTGSMPDDLVKLCFNEALKLSHYHGHPVFNSERGRPDRGYQLKTGSETGEWYTTALSLLTKFSRLKKDNALLAGTILTDHFRSLWKYTSLRGSIEIAAKSIYPNSYPLRGWFTLSQAVAYIKPDTGQQSDQHLLKLQAQFAPKEKELKLSAFVFLKYSDFMTVDTAVGGLQDNGRDEIYTIVRGLSKEFSDREICCLVPKLVSVPTPTSKAFGEGVATNTESLTLIWAAIRSALSIRQDQATYYTFCQGFLNGLRTRGRTFFDCIMDEIVSDELLIKHYIGLQMCYQLDNKCLNRLKQFAADERTSTESLMEIAGFVLVIPDQDLADIVLEVNSRKDGNRPALYLLHKRFQTSKKDEMQNTNVVNASLEVAAEVIFSRKIYDYYRRYLASLRVVLEFVLNKTASEKIASIILKKLADPTLYGFELRISERQIFETIIKHHPMTVLETFVDPVNVTGDWNGYERIFPDEIRPDVTSIDPGIILKWCSIADQQRYIKMAYCISPYNRGLRGENVSAWAILANLILENAEDKSEILKTFEMSIRASNLIDEELIVFSKSLISAITPWTSKLNEDISKWSERMTQYLNERISFEKGREWSVPHKSEEARFED